MCYSNFRSATYTAILVALSACTTVDDGADGKFFGTSLPLVTTASLRTIQRTSAVVDPETGRIKPSIITCAEPSPDVAVALSKTFSDGLSAKITPPPGASAADVQVANSLSSSSSQAAAQLGERLTTIQLLRDGLYRACEAYANGAITPTTYTLLVSRIDKLLVTLVGIEVAGGAFGRSGAGLGGSANGNAAASLDATATLEKKGADTQAAADKQKKANSDLDAAEKELAAAKTARDAAPEEDRPAKQAIVDDLSKAVGEKQAVKKQADDELAAKQKEFIDTTKTTVKFVTTAVSSSQASGTGIGGITANASPELAAQLVSLQANYLNNPNADSAIAACITELSNARNDDSSKSVLTSLCEKNFNNFINLIDRLTYKRDNDEEVIQKSLEIQKQFLDLMAKHCTNQDQAKRFACIDEHRKRLVLQ